MSSWPRTGFNDNQTAAATSHPAGIQSLKWMGPFVKTLQCAKFFFHLSLSPEVGVYKVGLIDESSVNSLHLVRVWKSGEGVRKKA